MDSSDSAKKPDASPLAGRFVVRLANQTATGLAAHEVVELLDSPEGRGAEVFRIHRVMSDGRMELAGVSPAALREEDCLLFAAESVKLAREAFDAFVQLADSQPPPCRVELQLARVRGGEHEHVVAMIFSRACSDAVLLWTKLDYYIVQKKVAGGIEALRIFQTSEPKIVRHELLKPTLAR